ncbi:uncharacterized protein LOC102713129 isoform X1 [Oryza brachyantha]|uniref:uncharacterized protein LOC102713129 isoform X1 n=1 Tax=Oryza brachyantha TaxID=4533 RepID=UPI0007760A43|nr:uncharacterized protein LOC102713129 isoform X1 [Oryza brachyantha]
MARLHGPGQARGEPEKMRPRWSLFSKNGVKGEKRIYFFVRQVQKCSSAHTGNPVEERVQGSLEEWNCALVSLKYFESELKEMFGTNWTRIHHSIYRYEKKNVYALLYSDVTVRHAAEKSIKIHLAKEKISNLRVIDDPNGQILITITGVKPSGRSVRCVFVDASLADEFIHSLSGSLRSSSSNVRVGAWSTI